MASSVVLASAGTGKTRKLVEVYLELLQSGVDPSRIVAVTFTEKAAAEMRERIRSSIYIQLAEASRQHRGRWMRILAGLPAAPISTIHGFCGRILRERGLLLDIDPGFTILNEQRSLDLARAAVVETLRSEIRAGNDGVAKLFGDFGLARLVETAVTAGYWLNTLGKDAGWLLERIENQQAAADTLKKEMQGYFERYGDDFESIGVLADDVAVKKAKHPFRSRDDAAAPLAQLGQIAGVETARQLSLLVSSASARFRTKKRALNVLDFDDLLLGVRDLLARFEDIRRHYHDFYEAVLVDEFQDTDEVQAEILGYLAPRQLMIVGDPKQSIYRFRRARLTVFFRVLRSIVEKGGVVEHLQENRRSCAPIAEFANRLSESMMDGAGRNALPDGVDLSYRIRFSPADWLVPKSEARCLGMTYVAADADVKAAAGRGMEAEALARLLKRWKENGTIRSWKDVAMLFRATTNMGLYLHALEAQSIPVYVLQGTSFYNKTEVSDLIALLELIVRPNDPLLRATVLSSSLAGMTFRELLESRASDDFDTILKPWIALRDRATAAEILEDVIRRTDFDVVMMAQRNGPQRVANIGKLIEITRDLARQGTIALDDVVRHLRDRARDTTVREAEAQIVGQDDEVVRMLTVHQAKGLEFEIVVIPDLAAKAARSDGDRVFFSDRWGLLAGASYGLHRKPLPHALILAAKKEEEDQQFEEEKRLLYVAVTRAKTMLVLGEGFAKHGGPWLQWVHRLLETLQPGAVDRAREGKNVKVRAKDFSIDVLPASLLNVPEQLSLKVDSAMVGGEAVCAQLRDLRDRIASRQPMISGIDMTPSDLSALAGCLKYFHWTRILGETEPGSPIRGDSLLMRQGSLAHRILERSIRPSKNELLRQNLPDLEPVFDSAEWKSLVDAGPERELPFMMHMRAADRDCWVRGRMDAVVGGDVPRVIDYKYAVWREGAEGPYEVQIAAYGLAVMKSLRVSRAVGELWFLKPPMKIVRREFELHAVEHRLQKLFARYIEAVAANHWSLADRAYCDKVQCGFREKCFGDAAG
jgi:ATP-dependent helicase/nuclease subunit A